MSDHFITKTSLAQADLVTIDGQAVVKADSVLREAIAGSDTPELGAFFATPVFGAAAADGAQSVSWYAAVAGKPKSLDLLDGAAREDVSERLAQRMAEIETLKMRRPDLANTLSAAQSVLSRGDILVIAGQPVAINWGPALIKLTLKATITPRSVISCPAVGTSLPLLLHQSRY